MRSIYPLLLAALAGAPGCSWLVIYSGEDPVKATTRDEARRAFGRPDASGVADGRPYDDFRSHRKIEESMREQDLSIEMLVTLGLSEVWNFPKELARAAWLCVKGHRIRYEYDAGGRVTSIYLNGDRLSYPLREPDGASDAPAGSRRGATDPE